MCRGMNNESWQKDMELHGRLGDRHYESVHDRYDQLMAVNCMQHTCKVRRRSPNPPLKA